MKQIICVLLVLALLLAGCGGTSAETTAAFSESPVPPVRSELHVYCFQAGKADAFLIWNEDGAALIDTGESGFGKTILAKLEALGIARLDYLILTHFDKDHVGGAKKLLGSVEVGQILQSNSPKEDASAYEKYMEAVETAGLAPVTVRERTELRLGDAVFTVDPPARESYPEDPSNNSSLIVTLTHGANRLLFPGDAEELRLREFLGTDPKPVALLKLPHHGKWESPLPALLEATKPAWAVITSSDEEPEDPETLELLERAGTETFLTRTAPVEISSDGETLRVGYAAP